MVKIKQIRWGPIYIKKLPRPCHNHNITKKFSDIRPFKRGIDYTYYLIFQICSREFGCEAISHLEEVSKDGIEAMAEVGTVAVILPTTAYILRLKPPPVRQMIDQGVIVALGTDFNPNAFCLSMVSL